MERTPVSSSNIKSVGYEEGDGTLEVEFSSGELYHYSGVSPEDHEALMAAPSVGKYLNGTIKKKYKSVKL